MALEDLLGTIVDSSLKHLERTFSEMAAGRTSSSDAAKKLAEDSELDLDEKLVQHVISAHSAGIATGLELAATEIGKARAVVQEAVDEMRAES